MANEITANLQLIVKKGFLDERFAPGALSFDLAEAAPNVAGGSQLIGFAAHEAVDIGDVGTAGWAYFRNLDAENYVEIGVEVAAAFYPLVKLESGEAAVFRLATDTPFAKADTGDVVLQKGIFDA